MAVTLPRLPPFNFGGGAYDWRGRPIRDRADLPLRWTPLVAAAEQALSDAAADPANTFRALRSAALSGRLLRRPRVLLFADTPPLRLTCQDDGGGNFPIALVGRDDTGDSSWGLDAGVLADYLAQRGGWLDERRVTVLYAAGTTFPSGTFLLGGLPQRDGAVIDPGQYLGGELLVLSTRAYDFACSFTGGYGGIYDAPDALDDSYTAYAVTGPSGGRFLLFRDADGVTEGTDADADAAVAAAHFPNFARVKWVFNWAVPTQPDVFLPDGYSPASLAVAAPFRHDAGLARGQDLTAQVAAGAGAAGSVGVQDNMTVSAVHAVVAAFFGG